MKAVRNDILKHARLLKKTQPKTIGICLAVAESHFKNNFKAQGFVDKTVNPWKPRKNNVDPGRPILIKTYRLKHGFRRQLLNNSSGKVTNAVPYAHKHNAGKPSENLVQRKFMGRSHELDKKTKVEIRKWINGIVK